MHDGDLQLLPIVNGLKLLSVAVCGVVSDSPIAAELVSDSDDNLFCNVTDNENHVRYKLLPERTTHDYNLRQRRHDLTLHVKTDDKNFLSRMLKLKTFISIIITYNTYFIILCILFYYLLDFLTTYSIQLCFTVTL